MSKGETFLLIVWLPTAKNRGQNQTTNCQTKLY